MHFCHAYQQCQILFVLFLQAGVSGGLHTCHYLPCEGRQTPFWEAFIWPYTKYLKMIQLIMVILKQGLYLSPLVHTESGQLFSAPLQNSVILVCV